MAGAAVLQASSGANVSFSHPFLLEETGVLFQPSRQHVYQRFGAQLGQARQLFPVLLAVGLLLLLGALFLRRAGRPFRSCLATEHSSLPLLVFSLFSGLCGHCG